jgi:hypothetical protein
MASGHFVIASTALAFILGGVSESVASTVIPLEVSVNGSPTSFYTADLHFNLPAGFTNASISISQYFVDDRSVMQLNGVDVASFRLRIFSNMAARILRLLILFPPATMRTSRLHLSWATT